MAATARYTVTNDWKSGFTADISLLADAAGLNGWRLEFDAGFDIGNVWGAEIVSHVGTHYVLRNLSWNSTVPANGTVSIGFQATPGPAGTAAGGFSVNGVSGGNPPTETLPAFSVADVAIVEGQSGTKEMVFTVRLDKAAAAPVSVAFNTADGTARAGSDYTAQTGTLQFAAGETSKVVRVAVLGDTVVEGDETLRLQLSAPKGASLADAEALGTIRNDDVAPSLPALRIGDVSVAEGNAGESFATLTVTLSQASSTPVSVSFATANGTAIAGSDFVAQTGTLTFAANETSKAIRVAVRGDTGYEANESFTVKLSAAKGATLADDTGAVTIRNDDAAPLPSLRVNDVSVTEGDPVAAGGTAPGYWSTAGNQIVDTAGNPVKIAGVNWFGMESSNLAPHGLWTRGYKPMMDQMEELGFNTIRLPFSSDLLRGGTPNGIDFSQNPDLQGLSGLQIMDKIVAYAGQIGLRIILDHHRSSAGAGASENGLWFDAQHPESQWIADWKMLAQRYAGNPTVIGADLHNEPYNGTWGGGGANDWAAAAERAGNAIGTVNDDWLIFVEGVGTYKGENYWWGGNLMGVRDRPIDLAVDNKLVYSPHDYPNSVYGQPWFQGSDFASKLPDKFEQMWGFIYEQNIAPVYLGEFGSKLTDPKDVAWLDKITAYLSGDLDGNGTRDIAANKEGMGWTWWSWNPNSGDTGGILQDDWRSVNTAKVEELRPIMFDLDDAGGGAPAAVALFTVSLSAAASANVAVDFRTVGDTAGAADFTATSGTLTFAPGERSKTVAVAITGDQLAEGSERFSLVLSNPRGATLADGTGVATILDDDAATARSLVSPASAPAGESVELDGRVQVVNSWEGGFNAAVTVQNHGAQARSGWQVEVEMANEITQIWNAEIVGRTSDGYLIRNAAWNGSLAEEAEASFGFLASGPANPSHIDLVF